MKKAIFFSFLLFPIAAVFAQLPEKRMQWQEQPLTWDHFTGEPDRENPYDANTNSGISYSWSLRTSEEGTEFLYKVEVFFYPDLSWVKPGSKDPQLLAHEQLHLNISELYGRKLRKSMAEFIPDPDSDIKKILERIYQKNESARRQMQEKYDRETAHGHKKEAQTKWEEFLRTELSKLKAYSS